MNSNTNNILSILKTVPIIVVLESTGWNISENASFLKYFYQSNKNIFVLIIVLQQIRSEICYTHRMCE